LVWRLGYGLDDLVSISIRASDGFSLRHRVQTGSGTHPTSYPMGIERFSPRVKWPGSEVVHSPPSIAEVKNAWNYTSTPLYVFMAWCLIKLRIPLQGVIHSEA
jgi:hypothetical protein